MGKLDEIKRPKALLVVVLLREGGKVFKGTRLVGCTV